MLVRFYRIATTLHVDYSVIQRLIKAGVFYDSNTRHQRNGHPVMPKFGDVVGGLDPIWMLFVCNACNASLTASGFY